MSEWQSLRSDPRPVGWLFLSLSAPLGGSQLLPLGDPLSLSEVPVTNLTTAVMMAQTLGTGGAAQGGGSSWRRMKLMGKPRPLGAASGLLLV